MEAAGGQTNPESKSMELLTKPIELSSGRWTAAWLDHREELTGGESSGL